MIQGALREIGQYMRHLGIVLRPRLPEPSLHTRVRLRLQQWGRLRTTPASDLERRAQTEPKVRAYLEWVVLKVSRSTKAVKVCTCTHEFAPPCALHDEIVEPRWWSRE
jgi:hypothetical protein